METFPNRQEELAFPLCEGCVFSRLANLEGSKETPVIATLCSRMAEPEDSAASAFGRETTAVAELHVQQKDEHEPSTLGALHVTTWGSTDKERLVSATDKVLKAFDTCNGPVKGRYAMNPLGIGPGTLISACGATMAKEGNGKLYPLSGSVHNETPYGKPYIKSEKPNLSQRFARLELYILRALGSDPTTKS